MPLLAIWENWRVTAAEITVPELTVLDFTVPESAAPGALQTRFIYGLWARLSTPRPGKAAAPSHLLQARLSFLLFSAAISNSSILFRASSHNWCRLLSAGLSLNPPNTNNEEIKMNPHFPIFQDAGEGTEHVA